MNSTINKVHIHNITDEKKWEHIFLNTKYSNISQDWLYCKIKSELGGWKIKKIEIIVNNQTKAIAQIYYKNIFNLPFLTVSYLNRGPIFTQDCDDFTQSEILKSISKRFSIRNGSTLIINPFIELSKLPILRNIFNFQFGNKTYTTSYIDLNKSEIDLKKDLKSKWRNQLNSSAKHNFKISLIQSSEYDKFIFETYSQMQNSKKFSGASTVELEKIFYEFQKHNKIYKYILFDEKSNICAYMIFLTYGNQVVYYLGWVSENARKLNPSNFLMWNSLLLLKKQGFVRVDLGGIDYINTPGVAKFKSGIGGEEKSFPIGFITII